MDDLLGSLKPFRVIDKETGSPKVPDIEPKTQGEEEPYKSSTPSFDIMLHYDVTNPSNLDSDSLRHVADIHKFLLDNDLIENADILLKSIEQRFGSHDVNTRIKNTYDYINTIKNSGKFTKGDQLELLGDEMLLKKLEESAKLNGNWNQYLRVVENIKKLRKGL